MRSLVTREQRKIAFGWSFGLCRPRVIMVIFRADTILRNAQTRLLCFILTPLAQQRDREENRHRRLTVCQTQSVLFFWNLSHVTFIIRTWHTPMRAYVYHILYTLAPESFTTQKMKKRAMTIFFRHAAFFSFFYFCARLCRPHHETLVRARVIYPLSYSPLVLPKKSLIF